MLNLEKKYKFDDPPHQPKLRYICNQDIFEMVAFAKTVTKSYMSLIQAIWLIFTRTVTPLEIFRWFPQIVFTLLTCVRPINVRFSNRFFCLSDKRCLMLIIKKNVEEDKS